MTTLDLTRRQASQLAVSAGAPPLGRARRNPRRVAQHDHPRNGLKTALNKWLTVAYGGRSGRATQGYNGGPAAPIPDGLTQH